MSGYSTVYLSPHLDDVVVSCGGQIARRTAAGERVLVYTPFAADEPVEPPSELVLILHRAWRPRRGLFALLDRRSSPEGGVVASRREEDSRAVGHLGAEPLHGDLSEAIYRLDPETGEALYASFEALFGEVAPADEPMVEQLVERLAGLPDHDRLLAPLAAGDHVDHRIARRAAEEHARRTGRDLVFYEDLPYASEEAVLGRALEGREGWESEVVAVSSRELDLKAEAVAAYASQLGPLFGGRRKMRRLLRRWHRRSGGERIWRRA